MKQMNLEQFIVRGLEYLALHHLPTRAHVKEPGFKTLYVRITKRRLLDREWNAVLDLSSIETVKRGKGTFKKLFKRLRKDHPCLPLYVENVLAPQFDKGLERMGFINLGPDYSPCFFFPPTEVYEKEKVAGH